MDMDVEARGHAVYEDLKLLVALCAEQSRLRTESLIMDDEEYDRPSQETRYSSLDTGSSPPSSMAIRFPTRSRQNLTVKRAQLGTLERTDENYVQQPAKNTLGLARTVRRTLSGGLSNILRPFQPPAIKVNCEDRTTDVHAPKGFHKLKRKVSSNFSRALSGEDRKPVASKQGHGHGGLHVKEGPIRDTKRRHSKVATTTGTKSTSRNRKVRESVCSRNSTISVLEYLAARREQEDPSQVENLVPLSEYGRNCHLYGCEELHIWNPDKNSSRPIIHCECNNDEPSKSHAHIDEKPLFYKPGGSTSTVTQSVIACNSSLMETMSKESLQNSPRPSNPVASRCSSSSFLRT